VDRTSVSNWLSDYVDAWRSYDRDAIVALFTEDATYRYHPEDEPLEGAEAIADSWLEDRDDPASWTAMYEVFAVDGDLAVASGTTHYVHHDGSPRTSFHNVFLMTFDDTGACHDFTEFFREARPSDSDEPVAAVDVE
jgi:ketosteroid isomerase-like protein